MSIDEEEGPIAELITYFDTASWLCSIMKLIMSYHVQVLATQDVTSQALMNIFMVSGFSQDCIVRSLRKRTWEIT